MEIQTAKEFLMWCTIMNGSLLGISFIFCAFAGGRIYSFHSRWFPMPRESFNLAIYSFMGLYKILFLAFNLIPYCALVLVA